jgi:hypothetical protein
MARHSRARWLMAASLAILCLPVRASSADAQPTVLELKAQPGERLRARTDLDFAMEIEVNDPSGGVSLTVKPRFTGWVQGSGTIDAVAETGDLNLQGRVDAFDLKLDLANLHLRAAIDPSAGGAAQLVRLPALPISAVVSRRGQLVSVKGLDKLPLPALPMPGGQKLDITQLVGKITGQFSQPIFPDHPVSPGDAWKTTVIFDLAKAMKSMGMPLPEEVARQMGMLQIPLTTTYTFTGYESVGGEQAAVIRGESPWKLELPIGAANATAGTLTEGGNTVVTMYLVPTSGKVVRQQTQITLEMDMKSQTASPVRMSLTGRIDKKLMK